MWVHDKANSLIQMFWICSFVPQTCPSFQHYYFRCYCWLRCCCCCSSRDCCDIIAFFFFLRFFSMISIAILLPAWNRLHFYYCNKIAHINSQISDRNGWKRLKYQNAMALNEPGKRLRSALYRSLQHPLIFLLLNLSLRWHILCVCVRAILFMI